VIAEAKALEAMSLVIPRPVGRASGLKLMPEAASFLVEIRLSLFGTCSALGTIQQPAHGGSENVSPDPRCRENKMHTIWAIIVWAVFGLVAGAIARLLVPGRQPMGLLLTMILGIIGSFVGGFLGSLFTGGDMWSPAGWIGSIIGAVIVLLIWVGIAGRRRHTV
jgi:uncharacterized membrane protein YeaQ/YmgE (transglycosylase-associated protein family)